PDMISNLVIQNFKSIKNLQLHCKRINLFIGEPNVGKSNILEALSLFALSLKGDFLDLVRYNDLSNLFFENDLTNPIKIISPTHEIILDFDIASSQIVSVLSNGDQMR